MWTAVEGLRKEGITVLLTTHYMEEADSLSDRLAILDHGKVLALGTPDELKAKYGAETIFDLKLRSHDDLDSLVSALKSRPEVTSADITSDGVRLIATNADGFLPHMVQAAARYGVRDLGITEPSLETVFIHLTGRDLRE
jgi:ABC-2 type transport system ATP-binding protein